jgi:hypothetical protein
MVLGIVTLLVVGVAKLVGGGSGTPSGDRATNVADTSSHSGSTRSTGTGKGSRHHGKKSGNHPVTRVVPSGPCAASDIAITPSVPHPVGGRDITIALDVSSVSTPACSWTLSPQSLAMRITSGSDLIWTTAQCSRSITSQDLVVRQGEPTRVKLTWDARRSEPGCPVQTPWALPGTYHLEVAALGGQPQEATFLLTAPSHDTTTTSGHGRSGKPGKSHKKHHHHRKPPPG